MGVSPWCPRRQFQGIRFETAGSPQLAVSGDNSSVTKDAEGVAAELDLLSGFGKITWYPEAHVPPDLRACTPQLGVKPGKEFMAQPEVRPLLANPEVGYGTKDGLLSQLPCFTPLVMAFTCFPPAVTSASPEKCVKEVPRVAKQVRQ